MGLDDIPDVQANIPGLEYGATTKEVPLGLMIQPAQVIKNVPCGLWKDPDYLPSIKVYVWCSSYNM